jgi:hypothetical protein
MQANVRSSCLAMCADSFHNLSDAAVSDDRINEAVATVADEAGFAEAKAT